MRYKSSMSQINREKRNKSEAGEKLITIGI